LSAHRRPAAPEPVAVRAGAESYAAGDGPVGVLLVHGFTGSPASMRPWAESLAARGFRVRVPRLPGHGTAWPELTLAGWPDWYAAADRAFTELAAQCRTVVICGLSMGGALALRLVERHQPPGRPADPAAASVAGLCLVNPALHNPDPRLRLLPVLRHLNGSAAGIANDIARPFADELGYTRMPYRAVASMMQLWQQTIAQLHRVHQPILLFRSAHDHVVDPTSARILRERVSSTDVEERILERSFHVATLDYDAGTIMDASAAFIDRVTEPALSVEG
jgi:carboxylesterase